MSWSIEVTGTKVGVSKKVSEQLDKLALAYEGKEEAHDVIAAKERILSLVAALDLGSDGYTDWNAVTVKANGSHSMIGKGIGSATMQLSVVRTSLALE